MSEGKINLFEFLDESDDLVEVVSVTMRTLPAKQYKSTVPDRTIEEYEKCIIEQYVEKQYRDDGSSYDVTVSVLKPEINPLELIKPAYAFTSYN